MELTDLKHRNGVFSKITKDMTDRDTFIYNHGSFNCEILKFKEAKEVLKIINDLDDAGTIRKKDKDFIKANSNKNVLVYVFDRYENPTIFVYGDDNIPFTVDCFV